MKQLITLVLLFVATLTFAQTRGINYKAKLADNAGITLANQNATVQFSIYEGNMGNNLVYQEEHTTTTDANGIVILNIGEGTNLQGDFTTINWGFDTHWLKTEVDTGSGFVEIGNTEFKTVPYALHAQTAETSGSSSPFAEASPNLVSANNTVADFVVGSPNTEDQSNVNFDGRLFWDDSKAAFRAGSVDGAQWNDVNRGLYSFAAGQNNTASGINSVAFGNNNTAQSSGILISGKNNTANASAPYSLIGGFDNISTAAQSLVVGRGNIAATNFQAVVGKYNNSVTGNLFTVGNGVDDSNRSNVLEVNDDGTIKAPSMTNAQITDDDHLITKAYFDLNTGDGLKRITENGNTGWRLSDIPQEFSDIGFEAVDLSLDNGSSDDDGGATGIWSFAANFDTKASGNYSAAFGERSIASGDRSFSTGHLTEAEANYSSAFGRGTKASNESSMAIGSYNLQLGNTLFEVGNGVDSNNKGNAFTVFNTGDVAIYKDAFVVGDTNVGGDATIDGLSGTGNANVMVDANGKLIRETTNTKQISIGAGAFRNILGGDFEFGYSYVRGEFNTSTSLIAPVILPVGSTITKVTYYFEDTNNTGGLAFKIHKHDFASNTLTDFALINTVNTTNSMSVSNLNISVNDNQAFFIEVWPFSVIWSNTLSVRGVTIEYTE